MALNAGSKSSSASAFFLPLERVSSFIYLLHPCATLVILSEMAHRLCGDVNNLNQISHCAWFVTSHLETITKVTLASSGKILHATEVPHANTLV